MGRGIINRGLSRTFADLRGLLLGGNIGNKSSVIIFIKFVGLVGLCGKYYFGYSFCFFFLGGFVRD